MLGWLKGLLSTPKAAETTFEVVKKGVEGIGKCFFTDQEKAEFTLKAGEMWIRVQEAIASENTIRSMTRRVLAVMILGTFLLLLLAAGGFYPFLPESPIHPLDKSQDPFFHFTQMTPVRLGMNNLSVLVYDSAV